MKSFKEYLTESKKVYEFKVKIAGECPKDCASKIKQVLAQYKVESVSAGKSTPIQEFQPDFPTLKNVNLTVFEVATSYPANSLQIRSTISDGLGLTPAQVIVRTPGEEAEEAINRAHAEKTGKAVLGTDYEASNHQDVVGEKHLMSFLKELNKEKHGGEQYSGINDELLATKSPKEKQETQSDKTGTVSAIGSKKVKLPDPMKE